MALMKSWVAGANDPDGPFPLNNLPYGVFSSHGRPPRCGAALGRMIIDLSTLEAAGLITAGRGACFQMPALNRFMDAGSIGWAQVRHALQTLFGGDTRPDDLPQGSLYQQSSSQLHMPFRVTEFTDFYAGRHHATNVGTMFRGSENALPPNWLHMPIGYNGRASSVVVSGTDIRRPWGQIKGPDDTVPYMGPTARFDIELELGAVVGRASDTPLSVAEANANIFGYVLLNDWSARDIQAWEYQPLGPFQSKATATSISPWVVPAAALRPFRAKAPAREVPLLKHLQDNGAMHYDIDLSVTLAPKDKPATTIAQTNARELYYSAAQQLAHHSTCGCPMRVGDLLGSGTISGPTKDSRGSLLELSWGGQEPILLETGERRSFIEDGDTLTLTGAARGDGYTLGFGDCVGRVLPALVDPYDRIS